jgi:ABC-2 type transport system permease protein
MWTVRTLALRLSRGALRMVPILLLGALLPAPYGLRLTVGPAAFGAFLLSFFLTLFLCACLTMLCYGLTFYVTDPKGVISIFAALSEFFSGGALPLPFFPPLLRRIAELSPFGSLQNVPLRLFGGDIAGAAILPALGLQALWCVVLAAAGYALLRRGLRPPRPDPPRKRIPRLRVRPARQCRGGDAPQTWREHRTRRTPRRKPPR